eukprot:1491741-Prymnesium_polylepis.1
MAASTRVIGGGGGSRLDRSWVEWSCVPRRRTAVNARLALAQPYSRRMASSSVASAAATASGD